MLRATLASFRLRQDVAGQRHTHESSASDPSGCQAQLPSSHSRLVCGTFQAHAYSHRPGVDLSLEVNDSLEREGGLLCPGESPQDHRWRAGEGRFSEPSTWPPNSPPREEGWARCEAAQPSSPRSGLSLTPRPAAHLPDRCLSNPGCPAR